MTTYVFNDSQFPVVFSTAVVEKDYVKAVNSYTEALGLVPENPAVLCNRSLAFFKQGKVCGHDGPFERRF